MTTATATATCSVDDCEAEVTARGLCRRHYNEDRAKRMPPCSVEGCDRPAFTKGQCGPCYQRTRQLAKSGRRLRHQAPPGMKHCYRCGNVKQLLEFGSDGSKPGGKSSICKACDREVSRLRYLAKNGGAYKNRSHEEAATERAYLVALRSDPCTYCGTRPSGVLDHIVPRYEEGEDDWQNLTGACPGCNGSKNATPMLHYLLRRSLDVEMAPLEEQRARCVGGRFFGERAQ